MLPRRNFDSKILQGLQGSYYTLHAMTPKKNFFWNSKWVERSYIIFL